MHHGPLLMQHAACHRVPLVPAAASSLPRSAPRHQVRCSFLTLSNIHMHWMFELHMRAGVLHTRMLTRTAAVLLLLRPGPFLCLCMYPAKSSFRSAGAVFVGTC